MAYRQISDEMILASGLYEKEENYWFNQLSGRLERTHFPTDYSIYKQETLSSKRDDRRMETVDFQLNGELFSRLMWLSNESHPRLHMILVAGILALLVKYSYNGEMDAMVGAPVYDQGIEGDFINTMVILRNHLRGDMTFKELLVNVKQTILEAMENQNYPFEILLDRLNHSESSSDFVFIDIFILLENIHDIHYIQNARPNTLFVFSCQESEERITGRVEYNALVYNGKSVERLIGYFQNLLNITLADPDILLRDIDIISKEEKEQLIDAFNDTDCSWPNNKTIHELFEEQVIKGGDRIAVTGAFRETPLQITYRQLNDQSNRIASILRDKGVQSNSIVALMLERSVEMIPAMLGVLKAGGAYLPLDPDHPQSRISGTLEDSRAKVLLTQQNVLKTHSFTALKGLQHTRIKPCVTSPCPPIASMDDLPFPDRSLVSVERYNHYIGQAMVKHSMALQGTRGCPYHCAYCHKIWPKKHVARSAENLYSEVKLYYDMGVRRFVLIDDIFNLDIKNSTEFFQKIINNHLDIKLFFPNGLRGDILTPEYIDLMVEAGTINVALALETASPRLQKLIKKNLNLDRLQDSLSYFEEKYPQVILELFTMHGFPTETEEEAMMTLDFIKRQKWLHFPYVHILKIYPNTEMADLAIAHGIRKEAIAASTTLAYHELPETLPFDKGFTLNYQADFFNNYFLNNERLRHVLPYQARTLTEDELVKKYDSYLPQKIDSFDSLLTFTGIGRDEINISNFLDENNVSVPDIDQKIRAHFPVHSFKPEALRILFLDLSKYFNHDEHMLYDVVEPPLGLIYVLTYLNRELGDRVNGKIAKSGIDFNTYDELKKLIEGFQPDVIGIRTLSLFKDFFHHTVSMIRQWGIDVPIIAGGPYATSDYSSVLQDAHIDVIVLGEGEIITSRLIETIIENGNRLPGEEILQTIPGIAFIPKSKKSKKEQGALSPEIIIIDDESFFSSSQSDHSMNPVAVSHPHRSAYVIYTSGSTGKPKGVVLEHRNVVRLLFNDQFQFEFSNRDIWTMFHSYCFDFSVWEMYGALLYGGKLMVVPLLIAKDTGRFLELIKRENVTVLNQTPSAFYNLIELELNERSLSLTIRYVIFGGEALHPARLKEWRTKYPDTILVNMYGITETTVHVTYKRIENHDIETGISNIGKPIPTLRVYIIDKNANFLPVGVSGELVVGGEGVGRGYLNRPELTFEMFSGSRLPVAGNNKNNLNPSQNKSFWSHLFSKRWAAGGILYKFYKSGDLARYVLSGDIEYLGRIDQQVKIRGYRIELGEIESRLLNHRIIKDAVILAKANHSGENYLCAYVVLHEKSNAGHGMENELKEFLSHSLPGYMIPSYFIYLDRIPLTPNGKPDRKNLPDPFSRVATSNLEPPRTEIEKRIVEIWADVLNTDQSGIGLNANFFDLGGHSLKATTLISRIHKAFDVKVSLASFFEKPTVRWLSENIEKADYDSHVSIFPSEKKEYYCLSSAQKRLYFMNVQDPHSSGYNIPVVVNLEGTLDRSRLEKTFKTLFRRHESFRTSFPLMNGKPVQRIHDDINLEIEYLDLTLGTGKPDAIIQSFIRPFELDAGPLVRLGLIQTETHKHILMLDMHHIITDGYSMGIFIKEFMALYGEGKLPPIKIHYKDYSEWTDGDVGRTVIQQQETYWIKEFAIQPPILNLSTDFVRPPVQAFDGDVLEFEFSPEETTRLKVFVAEEHISLFILILALYNVFLFRLTGQEDIVIGTSISGRRNADLETVIGMFVQTLALRNYPQPEKTFRSFLRDVSSYTLRAFENQDYPFEDLVEKLNIKRDLSRNPIFDVMVEVLNFDTPEIQIPGLTLKPYPARRVEAKFDIDFQVREIRNTLLFSLIYKKTLFKKETIEKLNGYFKKVAMFFLENPDHQLSEVELAEMQKQNDLRSQFNEDLEDE